MPKIDFTKAVEFDKNIKTNRADKAEKTVRNMINPEATLNLIKDAKIYEIDIDDIDVREVNEFDEIGLTTLKESIYNAGLQHNIVVREKGERYVVISGNRRLSAVKELHQEYPYDTRFKTIPCKICQIIGEGTPNSNYAQITLEQEELIYKDTNFENRQLGLETAIKHIDYLADKIENSKDFKDAVLQRSNENSIYNKKVVDKAQIIALILTDNLHFSGWSRSSVYRVLKIREKDPDMLIKIANNEISISQAYSELFPKPKKQVRKSTVSYKNVLKELRIINDLFVNDAVSKDNKLANDIIELCDSIKNNVLESNKNGGK